MECARNGCKKEANEDSGGYCMDCYGEAEQRYDDHPELHE